MFLEVFVHRIGTLLLILPFLAAAAAQQLTSRSSSIQMPEMDHSGSNSAIISGAEHPELIPDSTAYRLFFIAAGEAPNPTEARKARQRAFLLTMGRLPDADNQTVVKVLETFKVRYAALIADYNDQVESAAKTGGIPPDSDEFLKQRDRLVQNTRDQLALGLSADSMKRLDGHVQSEKRAMKIAAKVSQ